MVNKEECLECYRVNSADNSQGTIFHKVPSEEKVNFLFFNALYEAGLEVQDALISAGITYAEIRYKYPMLREALDSLAWNCHVADREAI